MRIKKVVIDNFRNIAHKEYDLGSKNIFIGPNYQGKTNTILAIYWVLTGYLLDGSSDDESVKPLHDTKSKVCVKLEMEDGWTIEKQYYEKWTKNRGTKEVSMTGNETQYYINNDKTGIKEALTELLKRMGYNRQMETSKFGLVRAAIDPYYMAENCDWRVLRSFIIELVGDVSNEDIYATDAILKGIKDLLTKYEHDTAKTVKHLKDHIKKTADEIETKNKGVEELSKVFDVEKDELDSSTAMIEQLDCNIAAYQQQKLTAVNPDIQKYENELASIQLKLTNQLQLDQQTLGQMNESTKSEIAGLQNSVEEVNVTIRESKSLKQSLEQEERLFKSELDHLKLQLSQKEQLLENGRSEYAKIKSSQCENLIPTPESEKCPHCGGVLNDMFITSIAAKNKGIIEKFEVDKTVKLQNNIETGKSLKLEVDNLGFKIKDKEAINKNYDTAELDKKIIDAEFELKKHKDELLALSGKLIQTYISDETKNLRRLLNELEIKLRDVKALNTTFDIDTKILECRANRELHLKVISKHNLYLETQSRIKEINKEADALSDTQCKYENQLILVEKFIQTKLSMLTKNVERVFGTDVKFTLVESNIKEGSWNEVCYPSILGKDTPFINGSESEKIIAGIYLIECMKKAMQLPDLPIIFDAGSELDSNTLAQRLQTSSQMIMTKVDDLHYTDVTLVQA